MDSNQFELLKEKAIEKDICITRIESNYAYNNSIRIYYYDGSREEKYNPFFGHDLPYDIPRLKEKYIEDSKNADNEQILSRIINTMIRENVIAD